MFLVDSYPEIAHLPVVSARRVLAQNLVKLWIERFVYEVRYSVKRPCCFRWLQFSEMRNCGNYQICEYESFLRKFVSA